MPKGAKKSSMLAGLQKRDRQFEVESAASAIVRAEEIRADGPLMKEVKAELKKREKALKKAIK